MDKELIQNILNQHQASIISHQEGLNKIASLRTHFDYELECMCLNSNFFTEEVFVSMIQRALQLYYSHSDNVVLKEAEFHELDSPYLELSIFVRFDNLDQTKHELENLGIELDIIHDLKELLN